MRGQIVYESPSGQVNAITDAPRRNELCVGADRRSRPHVADTFPSGNRGRDLLLRAYQRPDFLDLNALAGQVPQCES